MSSERRGLQRWPGLDRTLRFRTEIGSPLRTATIFNLSLLGIGILTDIEVPAGTKLTLQPERLHEPLPMMAEVRHATFRADGRWFIGCSLPRTLSMDEVQAL